LHLFWLGNISNCAAAPHMIALDFSQGFFSSSSFVLHKACFGTYFGKTIVLSCLHSGTTPVYQLLACQLHIYSYPSWVDLRFLHYYTEERDEAIGRSNRYFFNYY